MPNRQPHTRRSSSDKQQVPGDSSYLPRGFESENARDAGRIGQAQKLLHGKASAISHDGQGIFEGAPDPLEGGRYHSLAATRVPDTLEVCATSDDGEVMAVRHREFPVVGIQFHPESVLTPDGPLLGRNFLEGRR